MGQSGRRGGVDETQQIEMLRRACEIADRLTAEREEGADGFLTQRRDRLHRIGHANPAVTGTRRPFGPGQREQRYPRLCRRPDGVGADPRSEGMGRIDQMGHAFSPQIIGEALDTPETAGPRRDRLRARGFGTARIAQHRPFAACGQRGGQRGGLGRAAEQKDMAHG